MPTIADFQKGQFSSAQGSRLRREQFSSAKVQEPTRRTRVDLDDSFTFTPHWQKHPTSSAPPSGYYYYLLSSIHVCSGHTAAPATPLGRLRSWRAATREKTQCTASPEACRSPPSASPLGARQLHLGLARPRGVFARKQGEASRELRSRGAGCLRAGGSVVKEPAGHPSERKRVARGQV